MWAWVPAIASVFLIILWTIVLGVHRLRLGDATPEAKPKDRLIKWLGEDNQLPSWVNTLLSVVLSVWLAVSVGWMAVRAQEEDQDRRQRTVFIELLDVELQNNLTSLDSADKYVVVLPDRTTLEIEMAPVNFFVLNEAVKSGLFDPSGRKYMHQLILDVQEYNNYYWHALNCIAIGKANPAIAVSLSTFVKKMEDLEKAVTSDSETLMEYLESLKAELSG